MPPTSASAVDTVVRQCWGKFADLDDRSKSTFLRLFLDRVFDGKAGAKVIHTDDGTEQILFVIRAAGPPISELKYADLDAVRRYELARGVKPRD